MTVKISKHIIRKVAREIPRRTFEEIQAECSTAMQMECGCIVSVEGVDNPEYNQMCVAHLTRYIEDAIEGRTDTYIVGKHLQGFVPEEFAK